MLFLDILSSVLGAVMGLYGLFFGVIALFGLKKRKNAFEHTKPSKKICAIVAARNEETVIGQFIQSIWAQNYPKELCDVIVVPNNCTDDTRGAAERAGARIVEADCEVHSKGAALESAFRQILKESDPYDAFAVFDADNIAHPDFMQAANDALNAGARIAQGYRDSKNPGANWVSGGSSIFYWFMNRLYNHARKVLGSSAALNGTGFVVAASLIRENGFHTDSLTEDLEFTAQCAIRGERIYWMDDAITYDEQPETIKDAFAQRKRWFAGAMQCRKRYMKPLLRRRSLIAVDMALLFGGVYFMIIGLLPMLLTAASLLLKALNSGQGIASLALPAAVGLLALIIALEAFALLVCLLEKKPLSVSWKGIVMFPLFMLLWMLAIWASILLGPPEWKQIAHRSVDSVSV